MNIAGENVILNPKNKDRAEQRNAETPVFPADLIPNGRYMHIGDGIWKHVCRSCDDFILSYGSVVYLYEFAKHEASHAELLEAGISGWNVGMLK